MNEYQMIFIRNSEGVDRTRDDWDHGLVNFGYEACELLATIPLKSLDIEAAKVEAAAHWQAWLEDVHTENAEGYWVAGETRIYHCHVAIEDEDLTSDCK
jgi:hypothetical protein